MSMTLDMETQTMRFWVIKMPEDLTIGLAGGLDPWSHREGGGQCQKGEPGPSDLGQPRPGHSFRLHPRTGLHHNSKEGIKASTLFFWYLERNMNLI